MILRSDFGMSMLGGRSGLVEGVRVSDGSNLSSVYADYPPLVSL